MIDDWCSDVLMDCGMSCKIISLNLNWFLWLEVVRDYNKAAKREREDKIKTIG